MSKDLKFVLGRFGAFFASALLAAAVIYLVIMDIKSSGNIREESYVEVGQSLLVGLSGLIFMYLASNKKESGLWLVGGLLTCMFIRELDAYFDIIFHGAWFYFALPVVAFSLFKAKQAGINNSIRSLANYMRSESYPYISIGLLTTLVFSRMLGMKIVWQTIMGENFNRTVKNVVEEGTELYGYALIFISALICAYQMMRKNK